MATIACPGCGLPRAENEAEKPCPVCDAGPDAMPLESRRPAMQALPTDGLAADVSQLADVPATDPHGHRPWILAAVLGLLFGASAVLAVQEVIPSSKPQLAANPPAPPRPEFATIPSVIESVPTRPEPPPIPLAVQEDEDAVVVAPPVAAKREAVPVLEPAARAGEPPAIILEINRPEGSMQISRHFLGSGQKAVLKGRIKHVTFYGIEGLDIDATQLHISESAVVGGSFKATSLKLNVPGGKIVVSSRVTDGSNIVLNAPGGEVIFNYPNSGVEGGSKATITASRFECRGPIAGKDTHIDLTLSNGGLIRAVSLGDSAVLEYRKANRGDVPIRIEIPEDQIEKTAVLRRVE